MHGVSADRVRSTHSIDVTHLILISNPVMNPGNLYTVEPLRNYLWILALRTLIITPATRRLDAPAQQLVADARGLTQPRAVNLLK